jgi:hypothetical protein
MEVNLGYKKLGIIIALQSYKVIFAHRHAQSHQIQPINYFRRLVKPLPRRRQTKP